MLYDDLQSLPPALLASRDYAAIADALNATRTALPGKIERAEFAMWAASCGMRGKIENHANDKASPLRDAALACRDVILGAAGSIDFALLPNQIMLAGWVDAGELSPQNRDTLLAMATHPLVPVTAAQVEVALKNADGTDKP